MFNIQQIMICWISGCKDSLLIIVIARPYSKSTQAGNPTYEFFMNYRRPVGWIEGQPTTLIKDSSSRPEIQQNGVNCKGEAIIVGWIEGHPTTLIEDSFSRPEIQHLLLIDVQCQTNFMICWISG